MKKFDSFDEFVDVTKQAQEQNMKNLNCYLFPDEIKLLIEKQSLFYVKNDTTLQIITKHGRYFKVYFYGTDNFSFVEFDNLSLPVITDISYSQNLKERDLILKQKLLNMNFEINSSSSRMTSTNADISIRGCDYLIEKMNKNQVQDVFDIWEENFDPIQNLLYDKSEILENINSIFVLKNKEKKVVGAMEIITSAKTGIIQHVAIKKEFQNKGLGSYLEAFYIKFCKSLGINTFLLYTIDDKLSVQNFHKKFGFDFDGKHNIQLIYRR